MQEQRFVVVKFLRAKFPVDDLADLPISTPRAAFDGEQLAHELTRLNAPDQFKGLADAAALIADSIEQQQSILIIGDFDADGATSTALGVLALRAMGALHVDFLVPNRFEYGYGLTPEIVAVAAQQASRFNHHRR